MKNSILDMRMSHNLFVIFLQLDINDSYPDFLTVTVVKGQGLEQLDKNRISFDCLKFKNNFLNFVWLLFWTKRRRSPVSLPIRHIILNPNDTIFHAKAHLLWTYRFWLSLLFLLLSIDFRGGNEKFNFEIT